MCRSEPSTARLSGGVMARGSTCRAAPARQRGAVLVETAISLGLVVLLMLAGGSLALALIHAQDDQRLLSDLVRQQAAPASVHGTASVQLASREGLLVGTSLRSIAFALWPQRANKAGVAASGAAEQDQVSGSPSGSSHPSPQASPGQTTQAPAAQPGT